MVVGGPVSWWFISEKNGWLGYLNCGDCKATSLGATVYSTILINMSTGSVGSDRKSSTKSIVIFYISPASKPMASTS
jgi:hypothetical protein